MDVGDRVIIDRFANLPLRGLDPELRTGIVVARRDWPNYDKKQKDGLRQFGPILYIEFNWNVCVGCLDPKGAAENMARQVKALNPSYEGDGSRIVCEGEDYADYAM